LNRLITTFDEVPPIDLHASQRENHGVTFETLSAEVFSSDLNAKPKLNTETRKDSAVHVSLSSSSLVKQPGTSVPPSLGGVAQPFSTSMSNRVLPVVHHSTKVRSNIGANARLGVSRSGAALSDRAYRGVRSGCQRPMSTNRRIESFFRCRLRTLNCCGPRAPLGPQSCDDLLIIDLNRSAPAGTPVINE